MSRHSCRPNGGAAWPGYDKLRFVRASDVLHYRAVPHILEHFLVGQSSTRQFAEVLQQFRWGQFTCVMLENASYLRVEQVKRQAMKVAHVTDDFV